MKNRDIYAAAAELMRTDGAMPLLRERGTPAFMQQGGKIG